MTKWIEQPLRPQGTNWPGLNTRGGVLSAGDGALEDGSVGQIINEGDTLQKRKGLIRGLDERFTGTVCGLHKYTDHCGQEWILVADESQISIRQPFDIPVFAQSDAYPFDNFTGTGAPSATNWRNVDGYEEVSDFLRLASGEAAIPGGSDPLPSDRFLRWFKDATNLSYQVRIEYAFDTTVAVEQRASVSIKGTSDLNLGALLQADVVFDSSGTYRVELFHRSAPGQYDLLASSGLSGASFGTGFLTLGYTRALSISSFVPSVILVPTGGSTVSLSGSLNALQDASLGQTSSIGLGYSGSPQATVGPGIDQVDGGPL